MMRLLVHAAKLLSLFVLLRAAEAVAQVPPGRAPLPPMGEPPPPSPIDGLKVTPPGEAAPPPAPAPPPPPRRKPGAVWLGWTLGSGYGWHARSRLERRTELEIDPAFGAGGLGHFGPEIGYQWQDRIALSVQTRHQVIPRRAFDPALADATRQWAHTLLGRAIYLVAPDRYRRFELYGGGVLGVGDGFRFRVDPLPSQRLSTSDTVRSGPFVLGPQGGIIYRLTEGLSLVGELRLLLGLPDPGGMVDLSLGLQFDTFRL